MDPVDLCRALVRVPSVNPRLDPGGAGEGEVAHLCAGWLGSWGFETRVEEVEAGRPNVVATLAGPANGPHLLLNGHTDTVGVADMSGDPFAGDVEDGRLVGRGSCDMKGGLASILAAAHALGRAGGPARGRLTVALTADEEHASLGMQALVGQVRDADLAVVCEPTSLAVMPAHKGFVWMEATFRGRAAHGSRPERGIDAVRHAALWLGELEAEHARLASGPPHPLLGHGSFHVGTIEGGSAPSVYPDRCRVVLERRTLPGEAVERVVAPFRRTLDALRDAMPELDAELDIGLVRPGTEVSPDAQPAAGLLAALRDESLEPRVEGMSAWVDAAFLNEAGVPTVCFGPGSIAHAHAAEEWVPVEEVRACARVLERWLLRHLRP